MGKDVDRIRAREVVPNLDKVSAPRRKAKRRGDSYSMLERDCLRMAENIQEQRRREEDHHLSLSFVSSSRSLQTGLPKPKRFLEEFRKDPTKARPANPSWPTSSEKKELRLVLEKRAEKPALTNGELVAMVKDLTDRGVDEVGRVLGASAMAVLNAKNASDAPFLAKVFEDPEASVTVAEVVAWLLEHEWPRPDHTENDKLVEKHLRDAMSAEASRQAETTATCRSTAFRLARGHSYLGTPSADWSEARSGASRPAAPKPRGDVFRQSFLLSASGALQTRHTQLTAGGRSASVP